MLFSACLRNKKPKFPNLHDDIVLLRSVQSLWGNGVSVNFFFFSFHRHYSSLWALACRTMSFHFFLSATNSLHLLTPSTWRSLSTSSYYLFLGLPLLLVPSSSWVKIFLDTLSSSILSRWPNQLILCPYIHFTIFPPLFISSSSRFVRHFHSPTNQILFHKYLINWNSKYRLCKNMTRQYYVSTPAQYWQENNK